MKKPQVHDFVKIYNYFGENFEIGRIGHASMLTPKILEVYGIAQNNKDWMYIQFSIGFDKLVFESFEKINLETVWTARSKSIKDVKNG